MATVIHRYKDSEIIWDSPGYGAIICGTQTSTFHFFFWGGVGKWGGFDIYIVYAYSWAVFSPGDGIG